jgi:dimeric dUTPase (all-alpha-NTP-PPase superfamily)
MNLAPLFEHQSKLDAVIIEKHGLQGQDLLPQKILALQVELGELANEQRTWKFWSEDREPRTSKKSIKFIKSEEANFIDFDESNPLLEEYVDGIHFVLSIGNDIGFSFSSVNSVFEHNVYFYSTKDITEPFNNVFEYISSFRDEYTYMRNSDEFEAYEELLYSFFGLGKMLGFTWEEIEQAYYVKNEVNHARQANGY